MAAFLIDPKTVTFDALERDALIAALHAREDDLIRRIKKAVRPDRLKDELARVQDCICRLT